MKNRNVYFFALTIALITIGLWGSTRLLISFSVLDKAPSFMGVILAVLAISTLLIYYVLQRMKPADSMDFVRNFLLSVVLKLIMSGVLIMILINLDSVGANGNALFFMIGYLIFTIAEVTAIYLKKSKE
jgi:hypothetical protein